MIKRLLNSAIAKYRDLSVARRSIICLCFRHQEIIDLLATDKSRYFAQSRSIIVYYLYYDFVFTPIFINLIYAPTFCLFSEHAAANAGHMIPRHYYLLSVSAILFLCADQNEGVTSPPGIIGHNFHLIRYHGKYSGTFY